MTRCRWMEATSLPPAARRSALAVLAACSKQPQPGEVLDEAKRAGRDAASFPHADEDYFHDMDGGVALTPDEIKGRNMWLVWSGGNDRLWNGMTEYTFGAFDLLKIVSSHPSLGYSRDQPLELLRPGQRALLRERDRRRPESPRAVAGRAQQGLPARSVREREQVSGRGDRRARQAVRRRHDSAGRLVLWLRHRHRRPAPVPESGFRREGREGLGRGAVLHRSGLLQPQGPGAPVSRRHVLRLLPCRPEPGEPAGRSGASAVGQPQLVGRRAVHVGRPALHLQLRQAGRPQELHVPARPHLPAGHDGYVAGLDRQHQQSAHDERGLRLRVAHGPGQAAVGTRSSRAASSTTSSSTTSSAAGR